MTGRGERNGHLAELGLNSGFSTSQQRDHRLFPYGKIRIITFSIIAVAAVAATVIIDHMNFLSERPGFLGSLGAVRFTPNPQHLWASAAVRSDPFPGRFMPRLETEARGQKPSLQRAQPLSQLLRPGMSPPQSGSISTRHLSMNEGRKV